MKYELSLKPFQATKEANFTVQYQFESIAQIYEIWLFFNKDNAVENIKMKETDFDGLWATRKDVEMFRRVMNSSETFQSPLWHASSPWDNQQHFANTQNPYVIKI